MADEIKKEDLKNFIRDIPDFPKEGILFKDISTLLQDPRAFKKVVELMAEKYKKEHIDCVVGVEARGFIFGAAVAYKLGVGFVPVRKKGKLPYKTKRVTYDLEYGTDTLEIHEDAIEKGARVLIIDDLLATGGTVQAVAKLIELVGAKVFSLAFLIELSFLKGREKLGEHDVYSLIKY